MPDRVDARTTGPTPWARVIAVAGGVAVLIGVLVTAFGWPAIRSAPNDVPLAVAGPPEAVTQVAQRLDDAQSGGFDVEAVDSAAAARDAIANRDVYGAIVLDPTGPPSVLTASAASPAVAHVLNQVATDMVGPEAAPPAVVVDDVVPLPDDDPRGVGLSALAFPMLLGALALGAASTRVIQDVGRTIAGALLGAAGGGMIAVLVAQTWLGALVGNYWVNAGVVALMISAVSLSVIGFVAMLREAGLALAFVLFLVLGNPLSGITSAPEMLPEGWGTFGQWLPLGAGGSALRSTAYFDGAAAGAPLLILVGWVVLGLLLTGMGAAGARTRTDAAAIPEREVSVAR